MMSVYDPDAYDVVSEYTPCPFHVLHPGESFAGCTCRSGLTLVKKRGPDRYAELQASRRSRSDDEILHEADVIRARRAGAI